ncbi:hypothetical protein PISMIDRAFT_690792 [Pisolithus microcarpus 441]|uniref:Uncharacterized protein n=1 Tax=Pisolithus microcarpus 441 TaxID=765257 RepID=A0A0C9Y9L3_9AGAM|nr:hypothetical protein PISMIDRAFT_690792 [Pisolithus microcarpus 441]
MVLCIVVNFAAADPLGICYDAGMYMSLKLSLTSMVMSPPPSFHALHSTVLPLFDLKSLSQTKTRLVERSHISGSDTENVFDRSWSYVCVRMRASHSEVRTLFITLSSEIVAGNRRTRALLLQLWSHANGTMVGKRDLCWALCKDDMHCRV